MSPTWVLLTIVVVGFFVVLLLTVARSYRSRRQGNVATSTVVVELAWGVIPWLILVGAVTPTVIGILHDSTAAHVEPGILDTGRN